jgi:FMN phosphatase YigB (HAD superfamily)
MNYYIDFDNTMYNTPKLTDRMLQSIANSLHTQDKSLDKEKILEECRSMFNRENIYDIYLLAKYFSEKYNLELEPIINNLNMIILNGEDLVFDDVVSFLENLKANNHKIYMLSYCQENLQYQSVKIAGSNLTSYFDGLYIVSRPKYELDINYNNGIFIDDNPKDLLGLYSKKPLEVIRMRRGENKYSLKDIDNCDIKEYISFAEVPIN